MKVEYKNLYTHFVFTTLHRLPMIEEENRQRIEKYISGIVNHHDCQIYAIYANPEHVHFLVSRAPLMDEDRLADLIAHVTASLKLALCKIGILGAPILQLNRDLKMPSST